MDPRLARSFAMNSRVIRSRALAHVAFAAVFAASAIYSPAYAYAGSTLLQWAGQNIIAPLGLIAMVVGLAAAFFRPEFVSKAIYAAIICAVLFFLIRSGDSIIGMFQTG
jgi:hypothetical protein